MKILLAILAIILFLGMIGDKIQENRNNYTKGFIATVFAIAIVTAMG